MSLLSEKQRDKDLYGGFQGQRWWRGRNELTREELKPVKFLSAHWWGYSCFNAHMHTSTPPTHTREISGQQQNVKGECSRAILLQLDYAFESLEVLLKGTLWYHSSWVEHDQLSCDINTAHQENSKDSAQVPEPSTLPEFTAQLCYLSGVWSWAFTSL